MPESRIRARIVPQTRPSVAAIAVSVTVNVMPSMNKYDSERMMTSKSKLLNTVQPPSRSRLPSLAQRDAFCARPEIPGNGDGAFKPAHALGYENVDDDVDDG